MAFPVPYTLCLALFLLLLPFSTVAQTYRNISLGSTLTADNGNSSWASPSGEFSFGFQQIVRGGFLLAIWFNKIPEKTIVWSAKLANRDNLAQIGSKVQLTADGSLVLNDPKGVQLWRASFAGNGAAYAAMLNSGNLVLASRESVNVWASFDQPTDTILPTQTLNSMLVARYSETNYSQGRFMFRLSDGNLELYTTNFPLESPNSAYWSTKTSGTNSQLIFNQSGYIYLVERNGSILNMVISSPSTAEFYQRAILEYDGVFRSYVYPKSSGSGVGRWTMGWSQMSSIPENICTAIRQDTSSGACGFNSYCRLGGDQIQRPTCQCPPGYSFVDPNDVMRGCTQNFVPQSCEEAMQEADHFDFESMTNTDWPLSDYEHYNPVNEDWCRQACLSDCFCAVAIYRNSDCWKKKIPLSNGLIDPNVGGKALIKVRTVNSTVSTLPAGPCQKKNDQSVLIIIGSVLLGSSVLFVLLTSFWFFFRYNQGKTEVHQPHQVMTCMNLRSFSYKEIEEATDGFKEELGSGSFGKVYKGVLAFQNRNLVAVKKLYKVEDEGEQEFKREVSAIGKTNHKNLVQLLGFCNEGKHRILVYEFMSNGSLASFLFGNSMPDWNRRTQIAFGIARGLFYLHEECSTQMIHCDIKPQNILLDDSLTARISDFGLAKLLKTGQTRTITEIRGTKGYVAPEWFKSQPITVKVDVYSFGILLLEIICCRKNYEPDLNHEYQSVLADWAYDCYTEGKLNELVECDEDAVNDKRRLERFVMIAIWCIQEEPSLRPTMKKVTQMLEGTVEVSVPPDPYSFISSTTT